MQRCVWESGTCVCDSLMSVVSTCELVSLFIIGCGHKCHLFRGHQLSIFGPLLGNI